MRLQTICRWPTVIRGLPDFRLALLDSTIRRLLEMHPRGFSNEQLLWKLRNVGIPVSASEILEGLNALSRRGEVVFEADGRWTAFRDTKSAKTRSGKKKEAGGPPVGVLQSVRAIRRPLPRPAEPDLPTEPSAGSRDELPDLRRMLTYFAATQRQDTRGQTEEYDDRHGLTWQLFRTDGHWWSDSELLIAMESLPADYREALSKRTLRSAAIGWPMTTVVTPEGLSCTPAFLLPVRWDVVGGDLVVTPDVATPSINPAWLRRAAGVTTWTASNLEDRLLDVDEPSLEAFSERLRHALATIGAGLLRPGELATELELEGPRVQNCAALFLSEDSSFTKGTAADLEALSRLDPSVLSGTALGAVHMKDQPELAETYPVTISKLTDSQTDAAEAALANRLTVVTGPPGTGKSQVILNLLVSALVNGHSVLFAAKNHQALDEIERRFSELLPNHEVLVRGRDSGGERDVSFLDMLKQLAQSEARQSPIAAKQLSNSLVAEATKLSLIRRSARKGTQAHLLLSEITERLEVGRAQREVSSRRTSLLGRILRRLLPAKRQSPLSAISDDADMRVLMARRKELQAFLSEMESSAHQETGLQPQGVSVVDVLSQIAESIVFPAPDEWRSLSDRVRTLEFTRGRARDITPADARAIIRHRPIWAMSTLSVASRIPLVPNLFDYVIFDEASQCDIASALPLLARARRAVVVGDPEQLQFIPGLGLHTEHALMDAAGLPKHGREDYAQSTNSLFAFADRRPIASRHFLRDQFRSAPAIVDYLNGDFYHGRLVNRREEAHFKAPLSYRPGLAWEDVQGQASQNEEGNINLDEARRVVEIIRRLAADQSFEGSVGVLSPFVAQVALISKLARSTLTRAEFDRINPRIATIDKFQGGEADVVLFSVVIGPTAPSSAKLFIAKERRRLNVAISRARALCLVVGDLSFAQRCDIRHLRYLAQRASQSWARPRPPFDSLWERRLDTAMKARGIIAVPQYPIGSRYMDFAIDPDGAKIDVEVDGRRWHTDADGERKIADRLRDEEMIARGWAVQRFWVHELANDMGGCLDRIERELTRRRNRGAA